MDLDFDLGFVNIDRLVDIDNNKTVKDVKTEVAAKTAPETEIKTVKTVKEIKRDKTPPNNPRTNMFNVSQLNNKEYLEADGDDDTGEVDETRVEGTDKTKNRIAVPEIESPNNLHNNQYHIPTHGQKVSNCSSNSFIITDQSHHNTSGANLPKVHSVVSSRNHRGSLDVPERSEGQPTSTRDNLTGKKSLKTLNTSKFDVSTNSIVPVVSATSFVPVSTKKYICKSTSELAGKNC